VAITHLKSGETERQKILLTARGGEANQAEFQRLAAQLENMQASQSSRGIVLKLDDVSFDMGKAQLKPGADRSIDQIAAFLNENPERRVQVEAFTDGQGANDFNLELSQSRADAVAMAIIRRGINAERVRAVGFGEGFPVARNSNDGSRQMNRRVEIIVSNGDVTIPGRTAGVP
jgi:outer membrane protein OmpA-like peptidoglycan-associated protein